MLPASIACRCQHSIHSNTTYNPSFQRSTEYTPCSIDQCEDAQLDEPPHMPPFPFPLAPSHTRLPHRSHSLEYGRHDQETAPATNTTAPRHRPGLTVHSSLHASLTFPSHQWLAMVHSSPCTYASTHNRCRNRSSSNQRCRSCQE